MIKLKQLLLEAGMGDCYEASGNLIIRSMGESGAKLVHGMVNGQGALDGVRFGHAWVEKGNKVFDYSNGREIEMSKSKYYALGHIKPEDNKYYKPKQAMNWMQKKKHWGPWEMTGDPIYMFAEEIPDDKREIGRKRIPISKKILMQL